MSEIDKLIEMIKDSKKIVFFGGAGVSTESGLKDFRSSDGLYNEKYKYPPEEVLSHSFFINHTGEFYDDFCWDDYSKRRFNVKNKYKCQYK